MNWLEERTGLGSTLGRLFSTPQIGGARWGRSFATAFFVAMVLTALSGIALSHVYAPGAASSWASVFYIEYILKSGWFVRSFHMMAAEATIVVGITAVFLAVLEARYRHRRDLAFWCFCLVVGLAFAFCITGNPLRWDNRGYFGFVVETNIAGEAPVVGKLTRSMILGGSELGNYTLTRLYTLHTLVLPLAAIFLGVASVRSAGHAAGQVEADGGEVEPYFEKQLIRDVLIGAVMTASILGLAFVYRAPLEAPADPLANYNARPEWYFMALYVIRNAVPAKLQSPVALAVPPVVVGLLVAIPVLNRGEGSKGKRMAFAGILGLPILIGAALTFMGMRHDKTDPVVLKSKKAEAKINTRALQIAKFRGIPPAGGLAMLRTDPILHGEELFQDNCASCHRLGEQGPKKKPKGDPAPVLTGWGTKAWAMAVMEKPDHASKFGNTPFKGMMPSMVHPPKDKDAAANFTAMKKADMLAIAEFLEGEAKGNKDPKHHAKGAELVERRCTSCHLFRGETDSDDADMAPELAGWGSVEWTRAQIANPGTNQTYRSGSLSPKLKGHMPGYADKLSDADIDLLARFVVHRAQGTKASK